MLDLNKASAWGIEGFSTRIDSSIPGERVVIVGEGMHNGVKSYKVKYYNEEGDLNDQVVW